MLVLSRKQGETIHIGDDLTIYISKVTGNRVAIGIEDKTDKPHKILRGELKRNASDSKDNPPVV